MDLCRFSLLVVALYYADMVATFPEKTMLYGPALFEDDTPQMILFTYSGNLTEKTRKIISAIFPEKFTNKNGCPIGITIYVVSEDADPCSVHMLYVRGHEVALSGANYTNRVDNWAMEEWKQSIVNQRHYLAKKSNIHHLHITGMRAQGFFPGDNAQFEMLNSNHFEYDSSLLLETSAKQLRDARYLWPFQMTKDKLARISCQGQCPNGTFDGLWEVPVNQLFDTHVPELTCAYLDECLAHCNSSEDVRNLLVEHLQHVRDNYRAPLHINLRPRTLDSPIAGEGIRLFIEHVTKLHDTWIVTTQQLVTWLKKPTRNSFLVPKQLWDCEYRKYIQCSENSRNVTTDLVNFGQVMDVNKLVLWQTIFLVIIYIAVYRYDRTTDNSK